MEYGNTFVIDDSAYRYPVYADGKIVSFYTIIDPYSDGSARQFGAEFADELNALLDESSEYFIVGYNHKAYAVVDGVVSLLADYSVLSLDNETSAQTKSTASDLDTLERAISGSTFDVNTDQTNISTLNEIKPVQTRADSYRYFKVEKYNQGSRNICWAVASTRIGNFMSSTQVTPLGAVNYINGIRKEQGKDTKDEGTIYDAQTVLSDLYGIDAQYYADSCTWAEVRDYIEDATLLYAAFYNYSDENELGHALCVNGYYIDGSKAIMVMESVKGDYKPLMPNSSGEYKLNYIGSGNLKWETSLIVPWQG